MLGWVGRFLADSTLSDESAMAFAERGLSSVAVDNFAAFAEQQGAVVPVDEESRESLGDVLLLSVVWARWGPAGYYAVLALMGQDVQEALKQFDNIETALNPN